MRCWNVPLFTTQNTEYMCSSWGKSNNCGFTAYGKKLTRNTKCINQKDIPTHFKVYQTFYQRLFHYLSMKIINNDVKARFFPVLKNGLGIISSFNKCCISFLRQEWAQICEGHWRRSFCRFSRAIYQDNPNRKACMLRPTGPRHQARLVFKFCYPDLYD